MVINGDGNRRCFFVREDSHAFRQAGTFFGKSKKARTTYATQQEFVYADGFALAGRSSDGGGAFSWVRIHRDLMGDQFFDERKFSESNVHVILRRLNRVIEDSQSRH